MNSSEHENVSLKKSRGKSRVISSRFLSPSPSSSPIRRNSTSNASTNNVHLGLKKHDRLSDGTRVCFRTPNQSHGPQVDTKENCKPSPWIDDEDNVILPGRFSVDECALHRTSSSSSRTSSSSLLYHNGESDSESSDVSFASTRSHKPGIKVSSKYLHDARGERPNNMRLQQYLKRTNLAARYGGGSMSAWALSPGRSLDAAHQASSIFPSSNLKPPRDKGLGKLLNLGFDFFRSKKKPSSPLKPKTTEAAHQLKLMNNRLVQWRFVNARASAANNNVASRANKQLLCAWDALTKLQNLVLQERINLQKKNLEMKLAHVLLSQVKHLEEWEDMGRQHFSSISMTIQVLQSLLSRVPLREGAKVNIESAVTIFQRGEAVSDAIISTVNRFAPTTEEIVPFASQLAEVVAKQKLMLEQCHDLLKVTSELEMQERSLKCYLMIQHKKTLYGKLVQD
ncbi:unnamed protein product [Eruca vesicaria subsp. sativa]|uniref:QWRF motif-containing protein 3 n=1 Tax=Eruca vesicaria subsp. sativa TaxID=29727 RepID=A0ABC8KAV1_ERUVS|nr:unnamed protein product [Eruca vesicaria subsp. sativa]